MNFFFWWELFFWWSSHPSRVFLHQLFHVHISSAVTHRFVVIARICWNVWIWGWMGFNWNMLLASGKSCIKKTLGFGRVKLLIRYLSLLKVTHIHKKKLYINKCKCQQSELNGIPTSFPILAAEIQMTMPGSNTLHWPRPKIVYIYMCRYL